MTRHAIVERLDAHGPGKLPRINGELTFSAPWEATVFALAVALSDAGRFGLHEFHQLLIGEIQEWERQAQPAGGLDYYQRWLAALEHVLCRRGLLTRAELQTRAAVLVAHDQHR
ncbi:nitrile hydratase accessory protein [Mycobacterium heidelbergense]|uniref:nitrile hydratase accessory protein n=1 Tax=Mycobacterium heidelbergense TaxID=53376 RepID=UPI003CEE1F31